MIVETVGKRPKTILERLRYRASVAVLRVVLPRLLRWFRHMCAEWEIPWSHMIEVAYHAMDNAAVAQAIANIRRDYSDIPEVNAIADDLARIDQRHRIAGAAN